MADDRPQPLHIGEMLKEARQRAGLDIGEVEQETKIRTRYLRALESEEWEALPGEVYTKSFLRTYAQLLGLDADALLDRYRDQREGPRTTAYPIGEPMLRARRRADQTGRDWAPGRGLVIGLLVGALLIVLLVLGLTGGNDGGTPNPSQVTTGQVHKGSGPAGPPHPKPQSPPPPPLKLELVANSAIPVCLLNGDGKKLLSGTMAAGDHSQFNSYRYELRFPQGLDLPMIRVLANGQPVDLGPDPSGPVSYRIDTDGSVSHAPAPTSTACP